METKGPDAECDELRRIIDEIHQDSEDLKTINRIITTVAEAGDLKTTLTKLMDEALVIVGLEGATICMVTPKETLELMVQRETSEATIRDLTTNEIKIGDCLCGNCAKDCIPLILQNREDVLQFSTREATRGEDIRFHAAFPLVIGRGCVGVLCVFTRTDKKPAARSLKLLETVTHQIAFVVERARLLEQSQQNAEELERRVRERTAQLETTNKELEAFSYSVSHDLRAPIRHINAFTRFITEDYSETLHPKVAEYLDKIRQSTANMDDLIQNLLKLSRISRGDFTKDNIDLVPIIRSIIAGLKEGNPEREAEMHIPESLEVRADPRLIRIVMENLLENAWKFAAKRDTAVIEVGSTVKDDETVYYVKDNGIGFNMAYADRLFAPFYRLNRPEEFEGAGIGLATVQRIIHRHGGRIWAESTPGEGAVFYFTLP